MEEAADAERGKASRPYDDVPELHDSLKDAMEGCNGSAPDDCRHAGAQLSGSAGCGQIIT